MNAILKKIDQPKLSFNGDVSYIRLHFELERGEYAMTDIVPTFRNYKNWKSILKVGIGARVKGLNLIRNDKIDADSPVKIYIDPLPFINLPLKEKDSLNHLLESLK